MPASDGAGTATPALMLQGTASHVGKSLMLAGLGRAFARRGLRVRPFKPQNMSNNAAVAADGGEIGRAQALQARACGVAPSVHMNPVLIKPEADGGAQLVVQGRVAGRARAGSPRRHDLLPRVLESFCRLAGEADLVLVEGAGSPAEVNLRAGDIANMGFALAAGVPVVIVADVDRGGAIASLVGTWTLLAAEERMLLRGYVINRLRGEPRLFADALPVIEERTGLDCLGVVPWFARAHELPAEDAVVLEDAAPAARPSDEAIRIAVPRLPAIANFDDLDPLAAEPGVALAVVAPGSPLPPDADLVLLPGSKSARADLAVLRGEGWDIDILALRRRGGRVLGLCGGYQMLGRTVADAGGAEGPPGAEQGLGLLAVDSVIRPEKRLAPVAGRCVETGEPVSGYEMHMGETDGPDRARPMLRLADGRADGARSPDGLVQGCYLHGLFAADGFRRAFLDRLRPGPRAAQAYEARVESALDALADHVAAAVDLDRLLSVAAGRT